MKKLLSFALSLCMLLSITAGIDFSAQAATGNEIVSYARQFIGYPYVYGTQGPNSFDCSGFVQYVFKHFGISLPASSSNYWNNPTAYGTVVGSGSTTNAQAGDVISWSGHVAIYTENGRCVEALNSNYGVTESVPVNSHTNGMNYKVIRINGVTSGTTEMTVPTISLSQSKYYVGDTVAFSWAASSLNSNLSNYWVTIIKPNGDCLFNGAIDRNKNSYSFVAGMSGDYTIRVFATPYNANSESDSLIQTKNISVSTRPAIKRPVISTNSSNYYVGDTVTIKWVASPSDSNLSNYWVTIIKPNGDCLFNGAIDRNKNSYSFITDKSGEYTIRVFATPYNANSESDSYIETKKIQVSSTPQIVRPVISQNKSTYVVGDNVTVSWAASSLKSNLSNYWVTIINPKNDCIFNGAIDRDKTTYTFNANMSGTYTIRVFATPYGAQLESDSYIETKIIKVLDHIHNYVKTTNSATCTTDGTVVTKCEICNAVSKTETILATGHTVVTDKAIAATYAKAGKTDGKHCSVCGQVIVAQKSVAKLSVPKITLSSVKSKKSKQITVTWKKNAKVTGYEIQYATNSGFTKNKKTVTVTKNSTTSKTISKLKSKTKYYVRVRGYVIENGKKYYSSWSSAKSVTTKK